MIGFIAIKFNGPAFVLGVCAVEISVAKKRHSEDSFSFF
jgi:hypothetical protein